MKLYDWLQTSVMIFEGISCITGFIYFKKLKNTFWVYFPFYLLTIVCAEITGVYLIKDNAVNDIFYTWFVMPVEFIFFIWLYYQYFKQSRYKKIPFIGGVLYLLGCLFSLVLLRHNSNYWQLPVSYMTGIIVLLCLNILFFAHLFMGDNILSFRGNTMFWVSIGLLVFYLVSSPFFILRTTLYRQYREIFWLYYYIQFAVNILMYILFSIAFIWGKHR